MRARPLRRMHLLSPPDSRWYSLYSSSLSLSLELLSTIQLPRRSRLCPTISLSPCNKDEQLHASLGKNACELKQLTAKNFFQNLSVILINIRMTLLELWRLEWKLLHFNVVVRKFALYTLPQVTNPYRNACPVTALSFPEAPRVANGV